MTTITNYSNAAEIAERVDRLQRDCLNLIDRSSKHHMFGPLWESLRKPVEEHRIAFAEMRLGFFLTDGELYGPEALRRGVLLSGWLAQLRLLSSDLGDFIATVDPSAAEQAHYPCRKGCGKVVRVAARNTAPICDLCRAVEIAEDYDSRRR